MKKQWISLLIAVLFPISALPCSAFFIPKSQEAYLGKSYDWHFGHGYITVNKRNVKKESFAFNPDDVSFDWVSKYGSITFNQYAHEFPLGGMNEAGLAIEILWLSSSEYPDASRQISVNESQWIQYILDTASDINELISQAEKVRIAPVHAAVHYIACDARKKCAVIEYLDKKLTIHTNTSLERHGMEAPSITNSNYFDSMDFAKDYQGFGGQKDIPDGYGSLNRFVRASYMAKTAPVQNKQKLSKDYPFQILDSVASEGYTKFNIVYNINEKKIFYRTRFDNREIRSLNISAFNYSCKEPTQTLNIENSLKGNVDHKFSDYSAAANLQMVKKSLPEFPDFAHRVIANYPNTTECLD